MNHFYQIVIGAYNNNNNNISKINGNQDILSEIFFQFKRACVSIIQKKWQEYRMKKSIGIYLIGFFPLNKGIIDIFHPKTPKILNYLTKVMSHKDNYFSLWYKLKVYICNALEYFEYIIDPPHDFCDIIYNETNDAMKLYCKKLNPYYSIYRF